MEEEMTTMESMRGALRDSKELECDAMLNSVQMYTVILEEEIMSLKNELRKSQEASREKDLVIQDLTHTLTHFESLAESRDAEIKELRAALCSSKDNEVFLTGQNISLIEEVARLEDQTEQQNEDLKKAVLTLQHQIVEDESFICMKDELLTKQSNDIVDMKEVIEVLLVHINKLEQSNSDTNTQLDTRQEEEILAGVSFREECSVTGNLDQLDVSEEPVALAAEASDIEAPPVEGQSSSWWRRCARGVQKVGLRVGITAMRVLAPLSILASCSICSLASDLSPLAPYYNIEHITPPPF
ncbi:hypothetical protein ABVT39_026816 [Epinephelus coioides]